MSCSVQIRALEASSFNSRALFHVLLFVSLSSASFIQVDEIIATKCWWLELFAIWCFSFLLVVSIAS
mgnify:CR=1 FL=1